MDAASQVERFHPIMLYSILVALKRYEPLLYNQLCQQHHLDAERIAGLFQTVAELAPGQLPVLLEELRDHRSYADVMFLAGRNAAQLYADEAGLRFAKPSGSARFRSLVAEILPRFAGLASFSVTLRGQLVFIEFRNSLFARNAASYHPQCGFYSGLFSQLGALCTHGNCAAPEIHCNAQEQSRGSCLFEVSL